MKKFISLFFTLLTLAVGQMWGATATLDASCITSNAQSYQDGPTTLIDKDGNEWKVAGYGATKETNVVIGKGGANYLETPNFSGNISSIKVTWSGNTSYYLALQTTNGTELEAKSNPSTATEATFTVSGSYKQLRLVGRRSSGTSNAAATITKVVVTYGSSCTPLTMSAVTATPGNAQIALSWPNVANANSYTVTCKVKSSGASAGTVGGVTGTTTKSCTITGLANGTEYTWSVMPVGSGSYCAENTPATGDATPNVSRTITYYDKDGQHTTSLTDGTNIATALNALYGVGGPTSCNTTNYNYFVGWKDGEISGAASSVTLLSTEVVNATTAAKSYYAVWSDKDPSSGSWTVASSIAENDVIVLTYVSGNTKKELTSVGLINSNSCGIVSDFTTAVSGTFPLTVVAGNSNGSFSFKNGNNYLSWSSGNTLSTSETKNDASSYTVSISDGIATIRNVGTNTRYLRYNTQSPRICWYENTANITIYKQASVSANYITTCCESLAQINGPVNLSQEAEGSHTGELKAAWQLEGTTGIGTLQMQLWKKGSPDTQVGDAADVTINTSAQTKYYSDLDHCATYYVKLIATKDGGTYCTDGWTEQSNEVTTVGYSIATNPVGGGLSLSPNKSIACAGDVFTITANSPDGSHEGSATILVTDGESNDITTSVLSGSTLTMPSSDITITATYAEKTSPSVGVSVAALDFESPKKGASVDAQTFSLTGSALTVGTLTLVAPSGYTVSPSSIEVASAGNLSAQTITVTPNTGTAGTFNGSISVSGAGVASTDIVSLAMTVLETYTVNWYVNGTKIDANSITDVIGTAVTAPSDFSDFTDCQDLTFVGWKEGSAIDGGSTTEAPSLAEVVTTIPAANKDYYAVFAEGTPGSTNKLLNETFTNERTSDNNTALTSLDNFTITGKVYEGAYSTIKFGSSNDRGSITSKELDLSNAFTVQLSAKQFGTDATVIYVRVGDDTRNISTTDSLTSEFKTFTFQFEGTEETTITIGESGKRGYIDDVVVTQKVAPVWTKWYTTCPHCNTVTLENAYGTNPANGSITLKQGNTEVSAPVETCEGDVTINVTNSPSLGYQLSTLTVSGIEGASVNAAKTQITIPQDGDGTLTVTATFVASPSITVTDGVDPVTDLNFGTPKKAAAVPAAKTFVITGANLTSALTVESSNTTLYAVSYTEGALNPTAGAVSATITVTPQEGITTSAGEKNANITISGGGLANDVVIPASMTVQETYTVKWWINNNTETPSASQTDVIDTDLEVPSVTPTGDCSELVFKGWLTAPLAETSATAPVGLITPEEIAAMKISGNSNYYAVFATETPGDPTTATWVLTDEDLVIKDNNQSSGYDKYAGEQEKDNIRFTIANIIPGNNSTIQFKASSGMMYNTDEMPGDIISIAINGLDLDVYEGTAIISSTPGNGKITKADGVYPFSDGKRYFHIKKSTTGAGNANSITVTYHSVTASTYSNYVTTCPHCNSVALEAAYGTNPANGSITLGKSEVKTCEEATVSIENTPATGYVLSTIALSNNITGASVNDAMTQITIPQGALAGTLTVTATFAAIDYAVTMTQTGGANAELTGAKNNAHYGETINITAENKSGYQFLGWEASPAVTFEDETALSTSFTMPNEAVEVTANYAKICTVKFYVGTSESAYATQTPHAGETVDLSSVATPSSFDATNYPNFIGWSATNFGAAVVEPALITGSEIINDDANYYAVFGNALTVETNNYAKVTAIESGKNYLVVAEASDKFYAMKNTVVSSYYIGSDEVAPVSNVITSDAAHKWQIAIPATGKMTIQNASAGYVYMYPGTGNYKNLGLQEEAYQFSYTLTEGKVQLEGLSDTYVQFTANYKNFAAKDEASDLYLYKQIINPTKWATKQIEEVTVSFNDNVAEEEITVPANEVVESGSDLDLSGFTPGARAGYQFSGWSLTTNGAVVSSLSNITENTPLYAIWAINHKTTIKFYAKGSDDPIATHDQTQGLAYAIPDLSTSLPAVPQGFTFVGWSASQINNEAAAYTQVTSVTPDVAEADNEMSLYAVYNREVTGSGDYVKVTTARADWSGQYLIVNEANNVAFNGNLTGNALSETSTTVSVSISENTIAQSTSMDNASFTFAQVDGGYSIQSHSGYFIGRNSSSTGMDVTDTYSATYKNTIDVDEIASNNNYYLRYNSQSGQDRFRYYSSNTSVNDIALYRKDDVENNYTTNPVVKYDITYLAGDAENVTGVCDADRQEAGNITLCDAPTCSDKDFQGWNDGSQTYAAEAEYPLSTDVTFTATWTPKPKYTVTYTANGGTGTAPEVEEYMEGETVTVKANSYFSKPGFVYAGWQVVYNDGENDHIITPDEESEFTMVAYNVTIKALWEEPSNQKWVRVESTDELATDGTNYIIVAKVNDAAMGALDGSYYNSIGIVKTGNYLNGPESMTKITLEAGSEEGKLAMKNGTKYIYSTSAKNIGERNDSFDWTITIANGEATINAGTAGKLQFNTGSPRFTTYTSAQQAVAIYREKALTPIDHDGMTEDDVNTYDDVEIGQDKTWTVSGEIEVGDVYMKEGAVIANSAEVTANDLYFKARHGKSNQIFDLSNITVEGNMYYDFQLCDGDLDADYWYSIAVPFDVDLNDGVFQVGGTTPLVNHTDFEVWEYDTQKRADTQSNGWKRSSDNMMHAGKAYLIGFNPGQPNIIRLKAAADWKNHLFTGGTSMSVTKTAEIASAGDHDNWNGLANPTGRYIDVNADAQVFNNNTHQFDPFTYDAQAYNFVVGTAFFVQTASAIAISNTDHGQYRAPKRVDETKCAYAVRITREEAVRFDNQIIVRASADATNEYEQGHDMLTMNNATSKTAAMLWTENYGGKRLAIEEAPLTDGQATYELGIYAPAAGTYTISVADAKDNADLYLTLNGTIIWNLSMSDYEIDLAKGTAEGYGLMLVSKAPMVTTGVDNINASESGAQKVIINEHVYILRGEKMYDATGRMVK